MAKTNVKKIKGKKVEFANRFQKFYHLNKDRLNKERKQKYKVQKKMGVCVRCKRKAISGINFCAYHRQKQKEYNARRK